jgi:hypothetical protein
MAPSKYNITICCEMVIVFFEQFFCGPYKKFTCEHINCSAFILAAIAMVSMAMASSSSPTRRKRGVSLLPCHA